MTLPFADKPEESSIYQDLKTITLQDLTPDQFDALRARMFSEGVNGLEDEYRRLLLLGLASDKVSVSGPLPNTQIVEQTNIPTGATTTLFTPSNGEVWQLVGASIQSKGDATSMKMEIGGINTTGGAATCQISTVTAGFTEFDINEPVFIGYPSTLKIFTNNSSSDVQVQYSLIRVR